MTACEKYPGWCVDRAKGHRRHIGKFRNVGMWHVVVQAEKAGAKPRVELGSHGGALALFTARQARRLGAFLVEAADLLEGEPGAITTVTSKEGTDA
ncbi:hypothetical protein [Tenggerimyces flavus]|uniref:Uncharacterized protein n=1 Tax=Tenggerimyces flavus TaxID=1708749 RepID=A0ABV7YM68_9ACTN|nr:hypothetical protein [Tenggerimyces flavus]MBM7787789.1 hypothetical protein [Tenggerimyces flavus]